jgi:hypothetical protein
MSQQLKLSQEFFFTASRQNLKENGEPGMSMQKVEKFLFLIKEIELLFL